MKKLLIIVCIVFASLNIFGQASSVPDFRVPDATTAFGHNLSIGAQIYNIETEELWVATKAVANTATLTTANGSFIRFSTIATNQKGYVESSMYYGGDDYGNVPYSAIWHPTTNDFTIMARIKTSYTTAVQRILDCNYSRGFTFGINITTGTLYGNIDDGTDNSFGDSNTSITDGEWHSVFIVFDRDNEATFYVDGVADGTFSITNDQGSLDNGTDLFIGVDAPGAESTFFNGEISDIQIFNRALTPSEVQDYADNMAIPYIDRGANNDELVTDGDMSSAGSWTKIGTAWDITGGEMVYAGSNQDDHQQQSLSITKGFKYRIIYDCSAITPVSNSTWRMRSEEGTVFSPLPISNGNNIVEMTAIRSGTVIRVQGFTDADAFSLDNLSIIRLGNIGDWNQSGMTALKWFDNSGNGNDGANSGATWLHQITTGFDNIVADGTIEVGTLGTSAGNFITHSGGVLQERTAAEVLSDIGAAPTASWGLSAVTAVDASTTDDITLPTVILTDITNTNFVISSAVGLVDAPMTSDGTDIEIDNDLVVLGDIIMDGISLALYQGCTWDSSADTYTRLGSVKGVATGQSAGDDYLPIQSDMRRCLLQDDGTINYYIDLDNPIMIDGTTVTITGTTDGTTAYKLVDSSADFVSDGIVAGQFVYNFTDDIYSIITAVDDLNTLALERDIIENGEDYDIGTANFGGADGQVMVEIPKFYHNHTLVSTLNSWYISKYDLPGFKLHPAFWKDGQEVNYRYYSAFEGAMYDDSEGAMCAKGDIATSLYASGDKMCSVAGQWAKTYETRVEYRAMAVERGSGWRQLDWYLMSAVQLLYLVEYADFNSQDMIGMGRTELSGGTWEADSYIGLTGLSIGDGNGTNSVSIGTTNGYLTDYSLYRGAENIWGNVWRMGDGITWDGRWTGSVAAQPVYVTNNVDYFTDETSVNMKHLIDASYIGTGAGYISNIEKVTGFIPSSGGASSTTKLTDYYYQYSENGRDYWRGFLLGGSAVSSDVAGVFTVNVEHVWSFNAVTIASRLAY